MNFDGTITVPDAEVELCAADEDTRYYLNHPYLDLREPDSPMLVATNGHYLVAAPVEVSGDVKQGHIPVEAIERARQSRPRTLYFVGDMCGTEEALFLRPYINDENVTFPEWRRVIPTVEDGQRPDIAFQGRYIDRLARALCPGAMYPGVYVYCSRNADGSIDEAASVKVTGTHSDVIAALMAIRQ